MSAAALDDAIDRSAGGFAALATESAIEGVPRPGSLQPTATQHKSRAQRPPSIPMRIEHE